MSNQVKKFKRASKQEGTICGNINLNIQLKVEIAMVSFVWNTFQTAMYLFTILSIINSARLVNSISGILVVSQKFRANIEE